MEGTSRKGENKMNNCIDCTSCTSCVHYSCNFYGASTPYCTMGRASLNPSYCGCYNPKFTYFTYTYPIKFCSDNKVKK